MSTKTNPNQANARYSLEGLLPRGSKVYTVLRSVSRSGMLRRVSVLLVTEGRISDVTGMVALALGWSRDRDGYLPIRGCGFNVATHVVGALSYALHQDEYCLDAQTL
jgi:hypothetical protein